MVVPSLWLEEERERRERGESLVQIRSDLSDGERSRMSLAVSGRFKCKGSIERCLWSGGSEEERAQSAF